MMKGMWLACIAAGGLLPLAALAHAKLLSTVPATGEQLAAAPKELTLRFNEAAADGSRQICLSRWRKRF